MRQLLLIISLTLLSTINALACSCSYAWNDSFSRTANKSKFVALIKVISFDEYLEREIYGHEGKMPYAMTVEVIKNYKGDKNIKKIKIFGDNGMLCRPYLIDFEINSYYLIAPNPLNNNSNEYELLACRTDYLKVDISSYRVYGKYSLFQNEIGLKKFESRLKFGSSNLMLIGSFLSLFILILFAILKYRKRNIK